MRSSCGCSMSCRAGPCSTTMIIVTHEMNFARDVADRILFMDGGVVVEQGPARQLIEHPQEERTRRFLAHYSE